MTDDPEMEFEVAYNTDTGTFDANSHELWSRFTSDETRRVVNVTASAMYAGSGNQVVHNLTVAFSIEIISCTSPDTIKI